MIPWRSRELYVILSISLSAVMGVSLISPSLPVIKNVFGLSDVEAGYIITLYTLPAIFLAPLAGILTDRLGRRAVLVPSLLVFGTAGTAITLVDRFVPIVLLRLFQGMGSTSLALISRTLVGDVYQGRTQNAVMGLNDAVLALGAAFFPILGGYLAGLQWYYPFFLYVFPCAVSGYTYLSLPAISLDHSVRKRQYIEKGMKLLLRKKILLLFLATFLSFVLLYGAVQTLLPLHLNESFGYSSEAIGVFISGMAFMIAVTSFLNGRLVLWFANRHLILGGFVAYGAGLIFLGVSTTTVSVAIGLGLFGVGHGLTLPSTNTSLVRSVNSESRGALMSLRTIFSRMGQTSGPVLLPLLGVILSYPSLYLLVGLATLTGSLLTVLLTLRLKQ